MKHTGNGHFHLKKKKEKYPISINNGLKYGNSEDFDSFI